MTKSSLPEFALSVRQPWAWAIIHAGKDIENRTWQAVNHGLKRRGRIAIHASQGMSRSEFNNAKYYMSQFGVDCPEPIKLIRGGIIGSVEVIDVVKESESPWFMGPRGLVLRDPEACDFIPAKGALGYFRWRETDEPVPVKPAKWMLPEVPKPQKAFL